MCALERLVEPSICLTHQVQTGTLGHSRADRPGQLSPWCSQQTSAHAPILRHIRPGWMDSELLPRIPCRDGGTGHVGTERQGYPVRPQHGEGSGSGQRPHGFLPRADREDPRGAKGSQKWCHGPSMDPRPQLGHSVALRGMGWWRASGPQPSLEETGLPAPLPPTLSRCLFVSPPLFCPLPAYALGSV